MDEKKILNNYLPAAAVEMVFDQIKSKNVHLKISRNRKTKFGDYRPPVYHSNHRISVNHNLNPYAFLITFIHEYAHLLVFEKFKNRVLPHGKEWKRIYQLLIEEYINADIFPDELDRVLIKSIQNGKASHSSDLELSRILQRYDSTVTQIRVEDLPINTIFKANNGKRYKKGEKQRIRYKCVCLDNDRLYLFHPLTPIIPVSK
ncbi:MAG: SprT-like domain-containing protein [Bacteroidales bacterium]|jgi:hypothetical protein|nr:SprT-like domain-containing protein [Bacteroidales bacterium]